MQGSGSLLFSLVDLVLCMVRSRFGLDLNGGAVSRLLAPVRLFDMLQRCDKQHDDDDTADDPTKNWVLVRKIDCCNC